MGSQQAIETVSEAFLAQAFWNSFTAWQPYDGDESGLETRRDNARREYDNSKPSDRSSSAALARTVESGQVLWALDVACDRSGTQLLPMAFAEACARRLSELKRESPPARLEVAVDMQVRSMTMPDAGKDECVVIATLSTSASVDRLLDFMIDNDLLGSDDRDAVEKRWTASNGLIGSSESERRALEQCLAMTFDGTIHEEPRRIGYNSWVEGEFKRMYRVCEVVVSMNLAIDYRNHPFDQSLVEFRLAGDGTYDIGEKVFLPAQSSLETRGMTVPRGYLLKEVSADLQAVAIFWGGEYLPECIVRFGVVLERKVDAAIWRRFVPLAVVVLFALVNATIALAAGRYIESVTTGVLPGVLIASVALQLSSAQQVPANAGTTVFDGMFTALYVHLSFLLVAVVLRVPALSWTSYALAICAAGYGIGFVIRRSRLDVRLGALGPAAQDHSGVGGQGRS